MILSAGAAGAAAAAEAERQRQLEEEEMMVYDLGDEWEFKILRSALGTFRNPNHLQRALEEESLAGWTLLEKFDDQRIRLKRPVSARKHDSQLSIDPYRTYFGTSPSAVALWVLAAIFAGIVAVIGVVAASVALVGK